MRVVTCLPRLDNYTDRLRMFAALSHHVDELHLLTTEYSAEVQSLITGFSRLNVIEFPRAQFNRHAFDWIAPRLNRGQLDVVHDNFGHLASVFQAFSPEKKREYRFVTTLYTNNWGWFQRVRSRHLDFGWRYVGQRLITLWRDRRICRTADRIFVLGPGHEHDLNDAHDLDLSRVSWIPSEVNTSTFTPTEFVPEDTPTLLFTGAVCRNKGIDILLQALSGLKHRDFRVKLIGRVLPWELNWFKTAVENAGLGERFCHIPQVAHREMPAHYQGVWSLVFPSRFEGSPRSVREALASGIPALVSDIPGHRGLDPEGRFLRFVSDFSVAAWRDAIEATLDEPLALNLQRRNTGASHMTQAHSLEAVAARLATEYRSVLDAPH